MRLPEEGSEGEMLYHRSSKNNMFAIVYKITCQLQRLLPILSSRPSHFCLLHIPLTSLLKIPHQLIQCLLSNQTASFLLTLRILSICQHIHLS